MMKNKRTAECEREGGKETERVREIVINLTTGKQLYFFCWGGP